MGIFDFFKKTLIRNIQKKHQTKKISTNKSANGVPPCNEISYKQRYDLDIPELVIKKSDLIFAYSGRGEFNVNDFYSFSEEALPMLQMMVYSVNDAIQKEINNDRLTHAVLYNPTYISINTQNKNYSKLNYHPIDYYGKANTYMYSIRVEFIDDNSSHIVFYYNKDNNVILIKAIHWIYIKEINRDNTSYNSYMMYKLQIKNTIEGLKMTSAYIHTENGEQRIFDDDYDKYLIRKWEYEEICKKIPDLAPKSLGGYTRMKKNNTANFQKILKAAEEHGIKIN